MSALLVSASRNDAALEQIIGRMSLERFVTAAHWQAEQASPADREPDVRMASEASPAAQVGSDGFHPCVAVRTHRTDRRSEHEYQFPPRRFS